MSPPCRPQDVLRGREANGEADVDTERDSQDRDGGVPERWDSVGVFLELKFHPFTHSLTQHFIEHLL